MRTLGEIAFRLQQETANLWMLARPPRAELKAAAPLAGLPDPGAVAARLRGTGHAREVERIAERVLAHRFPLLGIEIETGPRIQWRRDYSSGRVTGTPYFRLVPYLDCQRAGDHKLIWELNRHQHLVLLAQAWRLTGRREFFSEIAAQLESWLEQNPFPRGINWASALEAGFRALSWIWVWHLAGERMDARFRTRFLTELDRHGHYLEANLSHYFSPNTHLLGEAVALHALGALFPGFPRAARWERTGSRVVGEQMEAQVRDDGSHFEQSSYYQVYARDMFLFHGLLARPPEPYWRKLARMSGYLDALMGPSGRLPLLGDDDGGRFFHPYGPRELHGPEFAWWPAGAPGGAAPPTFFPEAGIIILGSGGLHVIFDAGPFGAGSAGHSHSDTLSLVVRRGEEEILIDPGTYTYVADPKLRDWFRGSAAHNTVRLDGLDQADPADPFRWSGKPVVEILRHGDTRAEAVCRYRGFSHHRRVELRAAGVLGVVDEIDGPGGEHLVEQFWHPGAPLTRLGDGAFRIGERAVLRLDPGSRIEVIPGWRSRAFGRKEPAAVVSVSRRARLPLRLEAELESSAAAGAMG